MTGNGQGVVVHPAHDAGVSRSRIFTAKEMRNSRDVAVQEQANMEFLRLQEGILEAARSGTTCLEKMTMPSDQVLAKLRNLGYTLDLYAWDSSDRGKYPVASILWTVPRDSNSGEL